MERSATTLEAGGFNQLSLACVRFDPNSLDKPIGEGGNWRELVVRLLDSSYLTNDKAQSLARGLRCVVAMGQFPESLIENSVSTWGIHSARQQSQYGNSCRTNGVVELKRNNAEIYPPKLSSNQRVGFWELFDVNDNASYFTQDAIA
jgi:hypothetical protein